MSQDRDGFRTVAYFVNWAIYARGHHPQDIPADKLTHVLYAFANVRPDSGEVYLSDTWSDLEKHYPTDTWNEPTPGPHIYGCFKQLGLIKRRNRNLKTLLSIGGWTYSPNFAPAASTPSGRQTFAKSAVQLVKDCGFDGLDIDWEYPQNATEAADYVELLRVTREELDRYAASQRLPSTAFLLTVACPAGPDNYLKMNITAMDPYLDFWSLMVYDLAGPWDNVSAHQANIYPSAENPEATPFNAVDAIEHYMNQGVATRKIVLGCALYGRAFVGTKGPGHVYDRGVGEGTWEAGIWDWKVLPPDSSTCRVHEDKNAIASWSYDSASQTMVSFDSLDTTRRKAEWVKTQQLGGVMWWETSGDRKLGQGSSIEVVSNVLAGGLESKKNLVEYPQSKYANMRDGFPNG